MKYAKSGNRFVGHPCSGSSCVSRFIFGAHGSAAPYLSSAGLK